MRLLQLSLLCLTGCGTVNYAPYVGEQKQWPIRAGAFVKVDRGLSYYQTWPEKPYTILGHLTVTLAQFYKRLD